MAIKHKIKFKIDQARGPSPAELRSSVPKHSAERPATTPGVEGESIRRDVPANDNEYRCGGAYRAILKMIANQLDDEKFAEHCKKFFKGGKDEKTNT